MQLSVSILGTVEDSGMVVVVAAITVFEAPWWPPYRCRSIRGLCANEGTMGDGCVFFTVTTSLLTYVRIGRTVVGAYNWPGIV